ncbi:ATP-dependent RNA helicase RhlB [Marinimicrobium alkaliphilum]|uniref:ATP-dependent RNA helicase RhlB n=1 Tax=Marinimicrobium alkaliphilum TaxID=2202654 RepID=UPI001E5C3990|nr:ATP-dependent RNA helicase RhlB [Marinimicrobium alkaliphilum]
MIGKLFKKLSGSTPEKASEPAPKARAEQSAKADTKSRNGNTARPAKNPNPGRSRPDATSKDDKAPTGNRKRRSRGGRKGAQKPASAPWDISQFPVPEVEGKTRFHDLGLPDTLMHAIADLGFEYCSPIQAQSLPHALQGKDVVGKAQTGTGKTAAFLVAIIDDLLKHPIEETRYAGEARALIVAPTRELVMQIADDAKGLCKYTDLQIHTLVGGMDYQKQQRRLHNDQADIVVATPGRLLDFCERRDVFLDQIEVLVLDEADRMLDMGFIPQVRRIVRQTPRREDRQTLFFSATFTDDVHRLVEQWTYKPVQVEIEPESVATDTVDQRVYLVSTEEKYTLLYNLIQHEDVDSLIVFANRRDQCRDLHEKLQRHGIKAGLLSGEVAQNKRVSTLEAFKSGELKVLVATDVAGRGIHISGISHVVNFTLPEEAEDYVHRIGRTGRAGKTGTSVSFACEDDAFQLEPIGQLLGNKLACEQPPEHLLAETPALPPKPRSSSGPRRSSGGGRNDGNNRRGGGGRPGGRR